jgi:hypothetical protein
MIKSSAVSQPLRRLLFGAALAACLPAAAAELWISAQPLSPAPDTPVELSLHTGEFFSDKPLPFSAAQTAALQLCSKTAVRNLRDQLPADSNLNRVTVSFASSGTHMVVYDSAPGLGVASADSFRAYLHQEGLDAIIRQREQAGAGDAPGRERYRRHAKTLLRVGAKSDGTYSLLTGQRLEIVPSADPLAKNAGDTLGFTLFFDSKPLPDTLVKAWHKRDGQTLMVRSRTGVDGKVALSLPYPGVWMISAMHMTAASDASDADWDSFWGSLTFELAPARGGR